MNHHRSHYKQNSDENNNGSAGKRNHSENGGNLPDRKKRKITKDSVSSTTYKIRLFRVISDDTQILATKKNFLTPYNEIDEEDSALILSHGLQNYSHNPCMPILSEPNLYSSYIDLDTSSHHVEQNNDNSSIALNNLEDDLKRYDFTIEDSQNNSSNIIDKDLISLNLSIAMAISQCKELYNFAIQSPQNRHTFGNQLLELYYFSFKTFDSFQKKPLLFPCQISYSSIVLGINENKEISSSKELIQFIDSTKKAYENLFNTNTHTINNTDVALSINEVSDSQLTNSEKDSPIYLPKIYSLQTNPNPTFYGASILNRLEKPSETNEIHHTLTARYKKPGDHQ